MGNDKSFKMVFHHNIYIRVLPLCQKILTNYLTLFEVVEDDLKRKLTVFKIIQ